MTKLYFRIFLLNYRKRFENYPEQEVFAEGNKTIEIPGIILGLRLTSVNSTDGLWEELGGGVNNNFVIFNFKGSEAGKPYDFRLEIFSNNAATLKLSIFLAIFCIILFLFK